MMKMVITTADWHCQISYLGKNDCAGHTNINVIFISLQLIVVCYFVVAWCLLLMLLLVLWYLLLLLFWYCLLLVMSSFFDIAVISIVCCCNCHHCLMLVYPPPPKPPPIPQTPIFLSPQPKFHYPPKCYAKCYCLVTFTSTKLHPIVHMINIDDWGIWLAS